MEAAIIIGLILGIGFTFVKYLSKSADSKISTLVNEKKLESQPDDTTAIYRLGLSCVRKNDVSRAIKHLTHLYELLPNFIDGRLYLALCYYATKEYDLSRQLFKDTLALAETTPDYRTEIGREEFGNMLYVYGHTLFMNKEFDEAKKYKNRAFDLGDKKLLNRYNAY